MIQKPMTPPTVKISDTELEHQRQLALIKHERRKMARRLMSYRLHQAVSSATLRQQVPRSKRPDDTYNVARAIERCQLKDDHDDSGNEVPLLKRSLSLGSIKIRNVWAGDPDAIDSVRRTCKTNDERNLQKIISQHLLDKVGVTIPETDKLLKGKKFEIETEFLHLPDKHELRRRSKTQEDHFPPYPIYFNEDKYISSFQPRNRAQSAPITAKAKKPPLPKIDSRRKEKQVNTRDLPSLKFEITDTKEKKRPNSCPTARPGPPLPIVKNKVDLKVGDIVSKEVLPNIGDENTDSEASSEGANLTRTIPIPNGLNFKFREILPSKPISITQKPDPRKVTMVQRGDIWMPRSPVPQNSPEASPRSGHFVLGGAPPDEELVAPPKIMGLPSGLSVKKRGILSRKPGLRIAATTFGVTHVDVKKKEKAEENSDEVMDCEKKQVRFG